MKEYIKEIILVVCVLFLGLLFVSFCFNLINSIPDDTKCIDGKMYIWQGGNIYSPNGITCLEIK